MNIDVQPGDTFTIMRDGSPLQHRAKKWRSFLSQWYHVTHDQSDRVITTAQFRTIAELAGHTVTEVVPEPEPVVVTHGIEHPYKPGVFGFVGTKEAITAFAKERKDNAVPITFGRAT